MAFARTKPKPIPPMPAFRFDGAPAARGSQHEACEALAGRGELPYNSEGVALQADMVMCRTYRPGRFDLWIRSGESWLRLYSVDPSDPGLAELLEAGVIESRGPSPRELEKQKKRDEEQRQIEQAQHEYAESRRIAAERDIRAAEERRQRNRDA